MAELKPILFKKKLVKELFPKNEFWTKGRKDNAGNVETIKYPIASNIGGYHQGAPASYPVSIGSHANAQASYTTEKIWADPKLVEEERQLLTDYDAQQDLVYQMRNTLQTGMADLAAYNYGPTSSDRQFSTSGTGTTRTNGITNGTGDIKKVSKADLMKIVRKLKKDNLSGNRIIGVITADQWADILELDDVVDYEKTGVARKLEEGIIGRVAGIEFMVRHNNKLGSIGLVYNGSTKNKKKNYSAPDTVNYSAGDRAAALFFVPSEVRWAASMPEVNIDNQPAGYLGGTIVESWCRFGATINRQTDETGTAVLIEST